MPTAEGRKAEKAVRLPISFPKEMYEQLRETAFRRHTPMSEIVREALRQHLASSEPQMRLPMWGKEGQ
ncbi:MAG: ribbon-helix-helix domain-containing protein [Candidatus Dormibacteria bacterium]